MTDKLNLACDYNQGAHPAILNRMLENNLVKSGVYGEDVFSESAREKIRAACQAPEADVWFLVGGTQTNVTVLDAILRPYEGVISVITGHICIHEAGAIEHGGHKILSLPGRDGKISAEDIQACYNTWADDANHDHVVMPGAVYLSHPTEVGTLYSLAELEAISRVCRENGMRLYVDGARLAYALACPENDVTLPDLARLCDVFYIGGTKCGTLLGEAVVFPKHNAVPHFFSITKQHGAVLAKGFVAGLQFDTLFTDNLYGEIGRTAIAAAERIRQALRDKGYTLAFDAPTNQIFVLLDQAKLEELSAKVEMSFWDKPDAEHTTMRFVTSWATTEEDIDRLTALL
ncbi:MAG: low specificity L-threonine aldolase [Oscillospiraceae bacterium]|nr:low specificity L-threonine aldolase [Oscillospiraceae bacterium]